MPTIEADYSAIPDELTERDQWLLWDASADTPRRPHWCGDWSIAWNNPDDWHSFEEAVSAAQERESWGIGYVFAYGNDSHPRGLYGALDLDGALNERGGPVDWLPSLQPFIDADAYIEQSPSGDGLHIPLLGFSPPDWWQDTHVSDDEHEGVEAYDSKFFTFTGDQLDVSGSTVAEDVDVDTWLADAYEAITGEMPTLPGAGDRERSDDVDLDVYDVISASKYPEGENKAHPFHPSGTGTNFRVDDGAETFRCWRHGVTGNALHLLGIKLGIFECGDWADRDIDSDEWADVFEAARAEGYDVGEPEQSERRSPPEPDEIRQTESWKQVRNFYADGQLDDKHARQAAAAKLLNENHFAAPFDTGTIWKYDPETGVYEDSGETYIQERLASELGAYYSKHEKEEILDKIQAQSYIRREEFNGGEDEYLLCCANGVLDLETRDLKEHSPEYYFTRAVAVEYDPDADASAIESFLDDITRRPADKQTMLEMVGHALLPSYDFSKFMILFGEGSNGKSTFFDVLEELLGPHNVSGWELQRLSENQFAGSSLVGKFANVAPDMPATKLQELGTLKSLTGGDTVMVEEKNKPAFEFVNSATLMFGANRPPVIPEASRAIKRRLVPIRLPYNFTPEDDGNPDARDRQTLLEELTTEEELSGLLNLALDGLDRLRDQGDVSLPESHEERLEYYEQFSDPIKEFRVNCLENAQGARERKAAVYDAYKRFCRDRGYSVKDQRVFWRTIRQTTLLYDESRPEIDGERVRVINDTKFTETGLEYAPASLVKATPDPGDADRVAALSSGDTGVTIEARIEDRETDMPDAIAEKAKAVDQSGEIRLTVWNDADAPTFEEGQCYRIENAMVDEYQGQVELYVNERTAVEQINAGTGNAPMDDSGENQELDTATDGGEYAQLKPKIIQNAPRSSPFDAVEVANIIDADADDVRDRLETLVSERGDMTGHDDGTYEFI